jgi:hypothetical protein
MRLAAFAVGALALLVIPGGASGREVARAVPLAGPVLTDDSVTWAEVRPPRARRNGRTVLVRVDRRGRRTRLITPRPARVRGLAISDAPGTVLASESHFVLGRELEVCGVDICSVSNAVDLVGGPWDSARLGAIGQRACRRDLLAEGPFPLDLDGTTLAFGCRRGLGASVVVRDLLTPSKDWVVASSRTHAIEARVAGHLIAWKRETRRREVIVVFDRSRRRVVYRARAAGLGVNAFGDWDLQADGKLAVAYRRRRARDERTSLAWFSPKARRPHPLRVQVLPYGVDEDLPGLRLARGRIAALTPRSGTSTEGLDADLVVTSLRGHRHRVTRFSARRLRVGDIDFDGRRVTWAAQRVDRYRETDCGHNPLSGAPCLRTPLGPTHIFLSRLPAQGPRGGLWADLARPPKSLD